MEKRKVLPSEWTTCERCSFGSFSWLGDFEFFLPLRSEKRGRANKKANFKLLNQCKNAEIAISKLPEKSRAEKYCDIPNRENVRVRIFGGLIALILFSRDPSDFFFDLAEKMWLSKNGSRERGGRILTAVALPQRTRASYLMSMKNPSW